MFSLSLVDKKGTIVASSVCEDGVPVSTGLATLGVLPSAGQRVKISRDGGVEPEWYRLVDRDTYRAEKRACPEIAPQFLYGGLHGMRFPNLEQ